MSLSKSKDATAFKTKVSSLFSDVHVTESSLIKLEFVCSNNEVQVAIATIIANKKKKNQDSILYGSNRENALKIKTSSSLQQRIVSYWDSIEKILERSSLKKSDLWTLRNT